MIYIYINYNIIYTYINTHTYIYFCYYNIFFFIHTHTLMHTLMHTHTVTHRSENTPHILVNNLLYLFMTTLKK